MRTSLLLACFALVGLKATAQCTPNPLYMDSVYGVWPDTVENFSNGMVGVFYSDTMNVLIPSNAGDIDPTFNGFTIDSVHVDGITGLPPGINVICHSQTGASCTYLPAQVGCGLVEGTPTEAGTFNMTLNVTAYITFLGVQAIPQSFSGYHIIVLPNSVGIADLGPANLDQVQTVPNPFASRTNIEFSLSKAATAKLKVFNLVGEELWKETVQGKSGVNRVAFDAGRLESGVYLYKVAVGDRTFTGRMVVNR